MTRRLGVDGAELRADIPVDGGSSGTQGRIQVRAEIGGVEAAVQFLDRAVGLIRVKYTLLAALHELGEQHAADAEFLA